jgi:uncharacterized Rmd1/YagE family protein
MAMERPKAVPAAVSRLEAHAIFAGERIDVRGLSGVADTPLVLRVGDGSVVLLRYGVAVFFGVPEAGRESFMAELAPRIAAAFPRPEDEAAELRLDPDCREGIADDGIALRVASDERLQIVAINLAKSVVLAHYEEELGAAFNFVEPLAEDLERGGIRRRRSRQLLAHIGRILRIKHKMVGRVEVREKPELLWERPELELLHLRLEDEYELKERDAALERKLQLIGDTAATVLELLQHRRSLRVEWYIVGLIAVEIVLIVYDLWWR